MMNNPIFKPQQPRFFLAFSQEKSFRNALKLTVLAIALLLNASVVASAQPGALDPTFGTGGKAMTVIDPSGCSITGQQCYVTDVALQPDGKIVVLGTQERLDRQFILVRYNSDGTLDTSFDGDGLVYSLISSTLVRASALAIQPDGKIVVAGERYTSNTATDIVVARYTSAGALDSSFGTDGKVFTSLGLHSYVKDVAVQADGKILVAGQNGSSNFTVSDFQLVRYNSDGTPDTSFDGDGVVRTNFTNQPGVLSALDGIESIAIQPDGKIVAVGYSREEGQPNSVASRLALARYNANGSLDSGFDGDGKQTTVIGYSSEEWKKSVALQPDGKILVSASVEADYSPVIARTDFGVFRYTATGALDTSFGDNGRTITPVGVGREDDAAAGIAVQPDGRIIVGGQFRNTAMSAARYTANGKLDRDFDVDGRVILRGNLVERIAGVALQPDGKLIIAGFYANHPGGFAVYRLLTGGTIPRRPTMFDFDGDRKADIGVTRVNNGFWSWYLNNSLIGQTHTSFRPSTERIVPADYDGDGKTDIATRFASTAPQGSSFFTINGEGATFGLANDIPLPFDWDGDGRADFAVFRPGTASSPQSYFYYRPSSTSLVDFVETAWGINGDKPVAGDYDGDQKTDAAVFRPSNGTWYILRSSDNQLSAFQFGISTDKLVPADYDGDGKTDIAVYRDGVWYFQLSQDGFRAYQFGISTDKPVPADYDGDGKTDIAVYRDGFWFWINSSNNQFQAYQYGINTDVPIPSAYLQ